MRYPFYDFLVIPVLAIVWVIISRQGNPTDVVTKVEIHAPKPVSTFDAPIYSKTAAAIAVTIKRPGSTLQTWLDYNLRFFDLVLIFMDDPTDRRAFDVFTRGRPVVLFNGSDMSPDLATPDRLMDRQGANNEMAITYALQKNVTWLMHLDPDELFYPEGEWSWDAQDGIGHISFVNHEAVPLSHRTANFFMECNLFKTVHGELHFMAYGNGKSVVRVTPGVEPWGPHEWAGFKGERTESTNPMILHYPYPSYESWYGKFKSMGHFSDFWYDDPERPNLLSFMTKSRDVVAAAEASNDKTKTAAREFFNEQLFNDEATRKKLLKTDDLRWIYPFGQPKKP
jgi:hypothetical protein